jgi:hypothetical protein
MSANTSVSSIFAHGATWPTRKYPSNPYQVRRDTSHGIGDFRPLSSSQFCQLDYRSSVNLQRSMLQALQALCFLYNELSK